MTINKVKKILIPSDEFLGILINPPIADLINEKIIVSLMLEIKEDIDALGFCDIMEKLVDTKISDIEIIRNGNFTTYVHLYQSATECNKLR